MPLLSVNKVDFADKTKKVIYNFGRFSEIEDPEIQAFLEYLKNGIARSEITMEIERDVEYTKTKLSFINAYMAYALHDRDVKLEGFNEGKEVWREKLHCVSYREVHGRESFE